MIFFAVCLTTFFLSFFCVLGIKRWAPRLGYIDIPNVRSSHQKPTPRGGGLSFVIASTLAAVGLVLLGTIQLPKVAWMLILSSLLVAAVSLVDDRWRLPAWIRFLAHFIGAVLILTGNIVLREIHFPGIGDWQLGWLSLPVTFLWVIGLTNAYNFMDGIDGLAAGQALITAVAMGWLGHLYGNKVMAVMMAVLAAAVLGFLLQNWPPARIFMGDVGSAFLGFAFAGWAVIGNGNPQAGPPFLSWVAVLSPFILDTCLTLVSRIIRGQRWYEAHREHFYQRLVRSGLNHKTVSILYLIITAVIAGGTILFYGYSMIPAGVFVGLVFVMFALIVILTLSREKRARKNE